MGHSAIYPGTFDPITYGHIDIIERGAKLFDKLMVAVADNLPKKPRFTLQERIELTQDALAHIPNVSVVGFKQLLVNFAEQHGISVVIRGLRSAIDFEYEFQLAGMNHKLSKKLETVFLLPSETWLCVSSSLVREIASLGGDVSEFVPPAVLAALQSAYSSSGS